MAHSPRLTLLSCLVLTLLTSGCSLFHMEPVRVVQCRPSGSRLESLAGTRFTLDFSEEMAPATVEKAFLCRMRQGPRWEEIPGKLAWEQHNSRLIFTPRRPITDPAAGEISISASAEDCWGNNLTENFLSPFSSRPEDTAPVLLQSFPEDAGFLNIQTAPLQFTFSEPILPESLHRGFSLSPSLPGAFLESPAPGEISWQPQTEWQDGVTYRWELSREITDRAGNPLNHAHRGSFSTSADTEAPRITGITLGGFSLDYQAPADDSGDIPLTPGIPSRGTLEVAFSEPIDPDSAEGAVTLSPATPLDDDLSRLAEQGIWTAEIPENLPWDEICSLTCSGDITDLHGNSPAGPGEALFRTNHPRFRPPLITRAVWKKDPELPDPQGLAEIRPWEPLDMTGYREESRQGYIDFYLDLNPETEAVETAEFLDSLELSAPAGSLAWSRLGFSFPGAAAGLPRTDDEDTVLRVFWDWEFLSPGMMTLETAAPWHDSRGNAQQDPWIITCPTEGTSGGGP